MTEVRLACIDRDYLFFPEDDNYDAFLTNHAKALCGICPIFEVCRAKGIENQEPYGIWGGLTPEERRALYVA